MRKKVTFIEPDTEMVFVSAIGERMPSVLSDWEVLELRYFVDRGELEHLLSFPDGNLTCQDELEDKSSDLLIMASQELGLPYGIPSKRFILVVGHAGRLPRRFWTQLQADAKGYGAEVVALLEYGTERGRDGCLYDYAVWDDDPDD